MPRAKANPNTGLTIKEAKFLKEFTDKNSPVFFKPGPALQAVTKSDKKNAASVEARKILQRPKVQKALREMLTEDLSLDENIYEGFKIRLENAGKDNRQWHSTVELWAKIQGVFAPDKHVVATITAEDRAREYADIVNLVKHQSPPEALNSPTLGDPSKKATQPRPQPENGSESKYGGSGG